jgi:phosphatidylglycerol---prolipoprotein diacylglyceryl transferase
MLSFIFWDQSREMFSFSLPFLGRPILWYGFFFALGFFLGYFFLVYLLNRYFLYNPFQVEGEVNEGARGKIVAEKALIYAVIGAVVGARIADVLFYQDLRFIMHDPLSVFKIWEGGLSSHGGTAGALVALAIFVKKEKKFLPKLSFLGFLDFVCLPAAVVAGCIRIGNFFNQEILGTCTDLPFGVVFGHPLDGSIPCPRHPVQIYESLFYFSMAIVLFLFRKSIIKGQKGQVVCLFIFFLYTFRFFIEFLKEEQSASVIKGGLTMGQYLSLPLILLSVVFFFIIRKKRARML